MFYHEVKVLRPRIILLDIKTPGVILDLIFSALPIKTASVFPTLRSGAEIQSPMRLVKLLGNQQP